MSTRPGTFIDIIETGWERNRDSRVVSTPHFGDITARLWEKLRVEALKMMSTSEL
jgi:NitT/TauT family transport system ATP-binding protein